jgi:DNA repair protein RecO (recombination protein O)
MKPPMTDHGACGAGIDFPHFPLPHRARQTPSSALRRDFPHFPHFPLSLSHHRTLAWPAAWDNSSDPWPREAFVEWREDGIVLAARAHGESALVVTLLTAGHGRHAGLVHGGASSRQRPVWQPGNRVRGEWRARLAEQLGTFKGELLAAHAARALDDPLALSGLLAACATLDAALPEREPHPAMFAGVAALLDALGHEGWPAIYVHLEIGLLQELGFGLDLEKCAATGVTEDLIYVSPRTGRAVSAAAGEPYKDKLLALPPFLTARGVAGIDEVLKGLELTGYFLERHVFWPHNKPLPSARQRFIEALQRLSTTDSG